MTYKDITLSAIDTQITPIIHAVQYDSARSLKCSFIDLDVSTITAARIYAKKPDGTEVYNDCTIDNGYVIAPITSQTLAVIGKVFCQLQLTVGDYLTTYEFIIIVEESLISSSAIESSNEYTALEDALEEVESVISGLPSKVSKAGDTMSGNLDMDNNRIQNVFELTLSAAVGGNNSRITGNNSVITGVRSIDGLATPAADTEAANKKYVDDSIAAIPIITVDSALSDTSENPVQNKVVKAAIDGKLSLSGGTMSGVLNMNGKQITNVQYPTYTNSAASKRYVDDNNALKEDVANKVTSIDQNSTDTQYPSAKCVYDLIGDINTILADLATP